MTIAATSSHYRGVMISSTFKDLEVHRDKIIKAVPEQELYPVAMEWDSALPDSSVLRASIEKVRNSSAYIGIIGRRYGAIPHCTDNPLRLSLTELEYLEAQRLRLPTLIFTMSADYRVREADIELDPEHRRKLSEFRKAARSATRSGGVERVVAEFNNIEEFTEKAILGVAGLRRHLDAIPKGLVPTPLSELSNGLPNPPEMYAKPSYVGSHTFFGRVDELNYLDRWASSTTGSAVLLLQAIGGSGKSMLSWQWATHNSSIPQETRLGVFWYSFYEKGANLTDFCVHFMAYSTGQPVQEFEFLTPDDLNSAVLLHLRSGRWLVVLDGLEQILEGASQSASRLNPDIMQSERRRPDSDPRAATRPSDESLMERLVTARPSKILATSRLIPRAWVNSSDVAIPGADLQQVGGLTAADAENLLRSCDVFGSSQIIRAYLGRICSFHPLVIGVIAGLVCSYLSGRGNFDAWARDPTHGGNLDLAELDLIGRRNHILRSAIEALGDDSRGLLSGLALWPFPANYDALNSIFDGRSEILAKSSSINRQQFSASSERSRDRQRRLTDAVMDLEHRGLLQYDRINGMYDLHPVVRAVASESRSGASLDQAAQRVVDHFTERRAHTLYEDANELAELQGSLVVVHALRQSGNTREAMEIYRSGLADALLYRFGAYSEILSLLQPVFGEDWSLPVDELEPAVRSYTRTSAALALQRIGNLDSALRIVKLGIDEASRSQDWGNTCGGLLNGASILDELNMLSDSRRYLELAHDISEILGDSQLAFSCKIRLFSSLTTTGETERAYSLWSAIQNLTYRWHQNASAGGTAYRLRAELEYQFGSCTEEMLGQAVKEAALAKNRLGLRKALTLQGEWFLDTGRWTEAARSLSEASQMRRESGDLDHTSEAGLRLAHTHLGQSPRDYDDGPRTPARAGELYRLAQLWELRGDQGRAARYLLASYENATADGEPYVRRHALDRTTTLARRLGISLPNLPPLLPTADGLDKLRKLAIKGASRNRSYRSSRN